MSGAPLSLLMILLPLAVSECPGASARNPREVLGVALPS
jgi:hypothetical protein